MSKITVNLSDFLKRFIYFRDKNLNNDDLQQAYEYVGDYISNIAGQINTPLQQQTNGIYLACAHYLYLQLNPDLAKGLVSNASQGSESVDFQQRPIKDWLDYTLSLTSYGMELLVILNQVQPPVIGTPSNIHPYYNKLGGMY